MKACLIRGSRQSVQVLIFATELAVWITERNQIPHQGDVNGNRIGLVITMKMIILHITHCFVIYFSAKSVRHMSSVSAVSSSPASYQSSQSKCWLIFKEIAIVHFYPLCRSKFRANISSWHSNDGSAGS